jgi:hypothetical protein
MADPAADIHVAPRTDVELACGVTWISARQQWGTKKRRLALSSVYVACALNWNHPSLFRNSHAAAVSVNTAITAIGHVSCQTTEAAESFMKMPLATMRK